MTVNTNGVKKNGHLFIDHLLSKHMVSCVQETKFADARHLSTFNFHLNATFTHKSLLTIQTCCTLDPLAVEVPAL